MISSRNKIGNGRRTCLCNISVIMAVSLSGISVAAGQSNGPISANFFGLSANNPPAAPWPANLGVPFASWRTLGVEVKWSDIEHCDGGSNPTNTCYSWTSLDAAIAQARTTGQDILYTIYATPTWASSNPSDTTCSRGSAFPLGSCDPPSDIDAVRGSGLGDGTNQHFRDFLTAITSHLGPGVVTYWEVWDEPNVSHAWKGTNEQLVRLAKDTYDIVKSADPMALVTTPPYVGDGIRVQFPGYLAAGGAKYADIATYHGYINTGACPNDCPIPENEASLVGRVRSVLQTAGLSGLPLFDTEGSWGSYLGNNAISDPDQQAAFTGRYYLMHISSKIDKFYWYSWNNSGNGHFYDTATAAITAAGTAYMQIHHWLVGATLTSPCSNLGTQWVCSFTGGASAVSEAIWDTNGSYLCSNGVCPTTNVVVPTNYTHYVNLAGNTTAVSNATVPVGSKPILVQGVMPDISVTQTASPTALSAGGTETFKTVVTNNTAASINNVSIGDNLDPWLTLANCSSTPRGVCSTAGNSVTVALASMAKAETDTITIVVTVSNQAAGTIPNISKANWTNASNQASNNWSTAAIIVGTPSLSYRPTSMNFGNQAINTTSAIKNVVVSNSGTGNLIISNVGTSGIDGGDFAFTTAGLPVTVGPNSQTTIAIKFTPTGLGTRTGTLYIYDNSSPSTITIGIGGNGAAVSTTALTSSANPSLLARDVTFTAQVKCSSFVPSGSITFKRLSTVLGTVPLSGGSAAYTTSTLPSGWQTITALYPGDNNCATSKASISQGVKLASSPVLSSTLNPSKFHQSVTFNVSVTSSDGGTPQGTVSFKDGSTKMASVTLNSSGQASFTTSALSAGTHSITAAYNGNAVYISSTSSALSQVVQ